MSLGEERCFRKIIRGQDYEENHHKMKQGHLKWDFGGSLGILQGLEPELQKHAEASKRKKKCSQSRPQCSECSIKMEGGASTIPLPNAV